MNYHIAYETIMEVIPAKEISRFKAILANYRTLHLKTKLQEEWMYVQDWDYIVAPTSHVKFIAKDFPDKLSPNMYIYDDLVVFVEHKGIDRWAHPRVTLLSLAKGFIKY